MYENIIRNAISKWQVQQCFDKGKVAVIIEALWRCRDAAAYKSYSPHVSENACLVQTPEKNHNIFRFFSENEMQK